jgi:hypothetical protein
MFADFSDARPDYWHGPDGSHHTWVQLTTLASGDLVEIPTEHIDLPSHDG